MSRKRNRVLWAKVLSSFTDGGPGGRVYVHVLLNNVCKITGVYFLFLFCFLLDQIYF